MQLENMIIGQRYELIRLIGSGSMGKVYRARDINTGEFVAVKVLKPEIVADDPEAMERFEREGDALRRLNHPNIVKMLAAFRENERYYLVMEYVEGGSLAELLAEARQLPIERVLQIALDLSDALTRTHRLNIIHRDLKPANVLVAQDGTPRLTDFGVAHIEGTDATESGMLVGTAAYMCPEAFDGKTLDQRADIWAFGILLFELLTGQRPFQGETLNALVGAILHSNVPDLEKLCPDIPLALVDLIYRMLEKDRDQRIPSVRLVGAEIEAIINRQPSPTKDSRPEPAAPTDDWLISTHSLNRHNLPIQAAPFVGREEELAELNKLFDDPSVRLVSIVGPGGMGKTRLAIEAATKQLARYPDGVYFVALAPLTSPDFIVPAIAEAVKFTFYRNEDPRQQILSYLREKELLLVMDNFEHLRDGVSIVADILQTAPGVKILATSRERLRLNDEHLFRIEGMNFPDWLTPQDALEYNAVKLFMQSARRVRLDFQLSVDDLVHISRICQLVQGMPLGILLAAAWVETLSLAEIAQEISKSLDFLEVELQDVPRRQRGIRAVFEYSWTLLSEPERSTFKKLSVFRGGFTREAAQDVTNATLQGLMGLVNKSLLRRQPDGRYEIHELLRQYAEERLGDNAGEKGSILEQHANYYLSLLAAQEPLLTGPKIKESLKLIETEISNIRIAWEWTAEHQRIELLMKAYLSLWWFFFFRDRLPEAEETFGRTAERLEGSTESRTKIAWAVMTGLYTNTLALSYGASQRSTELSERARQVLREQNARRELAVVCAFIWGVSFEVSYKLGVEAQEIFESLGEKWGIVLTGSWYAFSFNETGRHTEAKPLHEKNIAVARELQNPLLIAISLQGLAWTEYLLGEVDSAKEHVLQSKPVFEEFRVYEYLNRGLNTLGAILLMAGEAEQAEVYWREGLELARYRGNNRQVVTSLVNLAIGAYLRQDLDQSIAYSTEALDLIKIRPDAIQEMIVSNNMSVALAMSGRGAEAKAYAIRALRIGKTVGAVSRMLESLLTIAMVHAGLTDMEKGAEWFGFVVNHPALYEDVQPQVRSGREILAAIMGAEALEAAMQRGAKLDLDTVLKEVLGE